ncbi:hypothetical protein ABZ733_02575 [Streptomyces longwoodensis]|uniref:hypothetical protein n=1 Tax=Streptomyces longwoodensis TaxID=68231 RepID=UPI0034050F32
MTALRRTGEPERAVAFLADRSALVRACARYVVRQAGDDPVAWYRERCARAGDPLLPPGTVIGLAECGERADAGPLWALLGHPSAAVRARAVAGLRLLDAADVRRLQPLLDDPAPGVVRETVLAVEPSVGLLSEEWLGERLDGRAAPARARGRAAAVVPPGRERAGPGAGGRPGGPRSGGARPGGAGGGTLAGLPLRGLRSPVPFPMSRTGTFCCS